MIGGWGLGVGVWQCFVVRQGVGRSGVPRAVQHQKPIPAKTVSGFGFGGYGVAFPDRCNTRNRYLKPKRQRLGFGVRWSGFMVLGWGFESVGFRISDSEFQFRAANPGFHGGSHGTASNSSFTCENYNTYRAHPWSPLPLRRAHPGPGPHKSRVSRFALREANSRFQIPGFGFRVSGFGFRVSGFDFCKIRVSSGEARG